MAQVRAYRLDFIDELGLLGSMASALKRDIEQKYHGRDRGKPDTGVRRGGRSRSGYGAATTFRTYLKAL
jgi:hypothetical protein